MDTKDLRSWNDTVRQFSKEKSAWCLHLKGINYQSDGQKARMNVGIGKFDCVHSWVLNLWYYLKKEGCFI